MAEFKNDKSPLSGRGEGGEWKTINGAHIFIEDGQSVESAMAEKFSKKSEQPKDQNRIAKLGKQYGATEIKPNGDVGYKAQFKSKAEMKQAEKWFIDDGYAVSSYLDNSLIVREKNNQPQPKENNQSTDFANNKNAYSVGASVRDKGDGTKGKIIKTGYNKESGFEYATVEWENTNGNKLSRFSIPVSQLELD